MKEAVERSSNVVESMELTLRRLEAYQHRGYLFHGGKSEISELTPRQASDDDRERVVGQQKAVYASEWLPVAIVKALLDKKDPSVRGWRSEYSGDGSHLEVTGENFRLTPGYVHVLPRDSFIEIEDEKRVGDREVVSYEPVTPKDIVRVTPEILSHLPNVKIIE